MLQLGAIRQIAKLKAANLSTNKVVCTFYKMVPSVLLTVISSFSFKPTVHVLTS